MLQIPVKPTVVSKRLSLRDDWFRILTVSETLQSPEIRSHCTDVKVHSSTNINTTDISPQSQKFKHSKSQNFTVDSCVYMWKLFPVCWDLIPDTVSASMSTGPEQIRVPCLLLRSVRSSESPSLETSPSSNQAVSQAAGGGHGAQV